MLLNFALRCHLWSMSQSSSVRVTMTERMSSRWLTFINIEEAIHIFFSSPPSVGFALYPFLPSLNWKGAVHGNPTDPLHLQLQPHTIPPPVPACQCLQQWSSVAHIREIENKFWETSAPHSIQTFHRHFLPSCTDVLNAFKMLNDHQ